MELNSSTSSTRRNSFHGDGIGAASAAATAGGGGRRGGSGTSSVFEPTFSDALSTLNLNLNNLNLNKETSDELALRSSFPFLPMATTTTIPRSSSSSTGHGHHHDSSTTSSSSSSAASAHRRRSEQQPVVVPATPGRPLQFFTSPGHHHQQFVAPRRSVPSKWEDAEKWLRQSSDSDNGNGAGNGARAAAFSRQRSTGLGNRGGGAAAGAGAGGEDEKKAAVMSVRRSVDALRDAHSLAVYTPPAEVLLKDRFTDNEEPLPSKESFVFRSSYSSPAPAKKCSPAAVMGGAAATAADEQRRDVGTEMTPLGSSCQTPLKTRSPARHNTPASRSGSTTMVPYAGNGGGGGGRGMDISELADCHLAKLDLGVRFDAMLVNWTSKEEEEEEVNKSLRHFEATVGAAAGDKRGGGSGDCRWDDDDRAKSCIRYQREEAKIQAWINLESAKAEAQSRKLEVKIQKMRSNLEEKLMRRMTTVHRRAEEWRATAQSQHLQHLRRAASDNNTRRIRATNHHRRLLPGRSDAPSNSCACFLPCSSSSSNGDSSSNVVSSSSLLNYY